MARPEGQLERALIATGTAPLQAYLKRQRNLAATRSGEYDQQVEFNISGMAGSGWGSVDYPVTWEHPFIYAPSQRTVPFVNPHVAGSHVEFPSNSGGNLLLDNVSVISWNVNEYGWWVGATVRVAVCAPNAENPVAYQGVVHLTFQGYASPTDGDITT